jgi:hypothetical protein
MTYTEIATIVQAEIARTTTQVTTNIPTWINDAVRLACSLYNFSFMKTNGNLTVATAEVAGPTRFKQSIAMHLDATGDPMLYPIDYQTGLRHFGDTTGTVRFYSDIGDSKIFFFPAPSASVTVKIHYFAYPAELTGSGTNYLSVNIPELIVAGALTRGFLYLQEHIEAKAWEDKFNKLLSEAIARDSGLKKGELLNDIPATKK